MSLPISVAKRAAPIVAALLLLAALAATARAHRSGSPPAVSSPGDQPVAVSINARRPRPAIPSNFIGLSFEDKSIPTLGALGASGNLVALLRGLGAGVLRLGGVTADTQVAWLGLDPLMPPWAALGLTEADFGPLAALSQNTGWPVLLTLNMGHFDPQSAANEATAAESVLGSHLLAVSLGNEPDAFPLDGLRPQPWGFPQYELDTDAYRAVMPSNVPLAGPDVASGFSRLSWVEQESAIEHPVLLTDHFYPLSWCHGFLPTAQDLFTTSMHRLERTTLADDSGITTSYDVPLRIDETNNISCGGEPGVSDTFASALWAADFLIRAMGTAIAGVNFHDIPTTPNGYSPIIAATPAALAAGQLTAQPEYYALLMASKLEGDRPLAVSLRPGNLNVQVFAGRSARGREHVVIVDEQSASSRPLALRLPVPAHTAGATITRLVGPSPTATGGVTLGGAAVTPAGTWAAASPLPRAPIAHGQATVVVPPDSAALVTLYSP
ncbi:MAG TPA: hypothetical protein VHX88_11925 [Solirubrobacteraceae bacterium]|nr:hypothetical protein [Solirubrobacteraceae bacterium]